MKDISLKIPEIAFIAITRVAIGIGLGLLLADKFRPRRRKKVGGILLAVGAATTIPVAVGLSHRARNAVEAAV